MLREKINYYCILGEGLFNLTGVDLLGIASIAPLFLSAYGASMGLIGMLTTVQGMAQALMPLLAGGFTARAKSKRRLSLIGNGFSRSLMLLIPLFLLIGLPHPTMVAVFMCVFVVYAAFQPVTGLVWNYLLNDCLNTLSRPKLLGVTFTISGIISFGTSSLIKVIRDSSSLPDNMKYCFIFGLAAFFMTTSVLWFLPLKETRHEVVERPKFRVKEYASSLMRSFRNSDFNNMMRANACSYMSLLLNAFLYIYAANVLKLQTFQVSNMIIAQTLGQIVGGTVTGQVSARMGVKRMLVMSECAGLLVPLLELFCLKLNPAYPLMCAAVFFYGFTRSGSMGYVNYMIEVVEKDRLIFHIVTKGLLLLPISFLSTAAGLYIQNHSMTPVFVLQAAASLGAIFFCARLRLIPRGTLNELQEKEAEP